MPITDIVNLILSLVTASAILFAGWQIKINRKQLYLSTITRCISEFRCLGQLSRNTADLEILANYIDLTNEELFYFQHNYIPDDVAKEWIDGMIDFFPIVDTTGTVLNGSACISYLADNRRELLRNFPRIQTAFVAMWRYDFDLIYSSDQSKIRLRVAERSRLAEEILNNVKNFVLFG